MHAAIFCSVQSQSQRTATDGWMAREGQAFHPHHWGVGIGDWEVGIKGKRRHQPKRWEFLVDG